MNFKNYDLRMSGPTEPPDEPSCTEDCRRVCADCKMVYCIHEEGYSIFDDDTCDACTIQRATTIDRGTPTTLRACAEDIVAAMRELTKAPLLQTEAVRLVIQDYIANRLSPMICDPVKQQVAGETFERLTRDDNHQSETQKMAEDLAAALEAERQRSQK